MACHIRQRLLSGLGIMLLWSAPALAQDITSNLTMHLKLNETSGTAANDETANNNDGTLVGNAAFTTGHPGTGNGVVLDGTGDDIQVAHATTLNPGTGDLTVAFWANITVDADAHLYRKGNPESASGNGIVIRFRGDLDTDPVNPPEATVSMILNDGNATGGSCTFTNVSILNAWHHLAFVFDRDVGCLFYIDGTQYQTTQTGITARTGGVNTADALYVGSNVHTNRYVTGTLDDIRLYQRALSATDMSTLAAYTEVTAARRAIIIY